MRIRCIEFITFMLKNQSLLDYTNLNLYLHRLYLLNLKLNRIEVLIPKFLIDSNIGDDEYVLTNNVLKEYDEMKEEIENLKT